MALEETLTSEPKFSFFARIYGLFLIYDVE